MNADVASVNAPADAAAMPVIRHPRRTRPARRERNESCRCVKAAGANAAQLPMRIPCADWIPSRLRGPSVAGMPGKSAKGEKILTASSEPRERLLVLMRRRFQLPRRAERRIYRLMRTRRRAAVSKTAGRWFEANRVCQSLVFSGSASADAPTGTLRVPSVYRLREPAARAAYHGVGFGELEVEQAATGYAEAFGDLLDAERYATREHATRSES